MDKPWYRDLFRRSEQPELHTTTSKAEGGDVNAQFYLGLMFSNLQGEAEDQVQAAGWYLKAANLNHPLAQFNLGLMYANGHGVVKNEGEAMMWIRKAAEQGDAGAQFNLGTRYHRCSINAEEMNA